MGLDEALEELDGVSDDEFADALQDRHPSKYKHVFSKGFGAGKTEVKSDLDDAQQQLQSLKSEKEQLESKIDDLQGEQPETAELREKYEQHLNEREQQIETLQEEQESLQSEFQNRLKNERASSFQQRVAGQLKAAGVDEDYADFKAERAVSTDRVQFDDELNIKLYEDNGVPTPDRDDKQKHELFAKSLADEIPDKFISDSRPSSTGVSNTDIRGGTKISRAEFEKMNAHERKEVAQDESVTIVN